MLRVAGIHPTSLFLVTKPATTHQVCKQGPGYRRSPLRYSRSHPSEGLKYLQISCGSGSQDDDSRCLRNGAPATGKGDTSLSRLSGSPRTTLVTGSLSSAKKSSLGVVKSSGRKNVPELAGGLTDSKADSAEDVGPLSPLDAFRRDLAFVLRFVDSVGSWNIASSIVILTIFTLQSYSPEELYWSALYITESELNIIEGTVYGISFMEYCARLFASGKNWRRYIFSPFGFVDYISGVVPAIFWVLGVEGGLLTLAETLRVLRLLRLTNSEKDSRFVLFEGQDEMTVKLYNILIEFLCIFFITACVIYNIEHPVNDEFGDLGDSFYWTFLSLTGSERPWKVETSLGRLTALISCTLSIIVVPGQLARLFATFAEDMMTQQKGTNKTSEVDQKASAQSASYLKRLYGRAPAGGRKTKVEISNNQVLKWSPTEVKKWLDKLNMEMYSESFYSAGVDGEMLLKFVDEDVLREDFGVQLRVHRNKIMSSIEELRQS